MGLAETLATAKAAREAQRAADLVTWQAAIDAGVAACVSVRQADVLAAAAEQGLTPNLAWVALPVVPAGWPLEAWVDTEGVLDIEVPRDLGDDLVVYVEAAGLRCGIEHGPWPDRVVLHVNLYRAPPAPAEEV